MNFKSTLEFQKDFKKLSKKFKSLGTALVEFKKVLNEAPLGIGKHFNIITKTGSVYVVKARFFCKSLKKKDLRIIYGYIENHQIIEMIGIEFIEIYFKGDKENEDRERIKYYLKNCNSILNFMDKRWIIKPKYPADFAQKLPGYEPIILQLLYDRGLDNQEKIDEFLFPDYTQDVHDPFLFQDMEKAVARVLRAINKGEKVLIYGDYDADGVTASVLLEKTLKKLSAEKVEVFIPRREIDGYGLNSDKCQRIIKENFNLVITVDCGITNLEQIKMLKSAGIDTIVVDHHLEGDELPEPYAILNCSVKRETYPFKKLAGVGMAFKLVQALFRFQTAPSPRTCGVGAGFRQVKDVPKGAMNNFEAFEKWLLDLVALGTIGDVSPIVGENRTLVKYGLMVLNKTSRLGLRELIRVASLSNGEDLKSDLPLGATLYDLNVYNIAYQIVPRINAAGRVDQASLAYRLLTTEDELEAIALARDIQEKNSERQRIADQTLTEAKEIFGEIKAGKKILIGVKESWLLGVVGLVAGKLKDEFCRPVILFTRDRDKYHGSGRSIKEFNITQALHECGDILERFGGHSQACGLTISGVENYERFREKIHQIAERQLKDVELVPTLVIDAEVRLRDLNWELWDELEKFEPFAEANPRPLFLIKGVKVANLETVGKNGDHLRLYLSQDGLHQKAISFGTALAWGSSLKVGETIDLMVEFGVNEWAGNRELQFKVIDFKHTN